MRRRSSTVSGRRTDRPPLTTPDAALLADIEEYIEPIVAMDGFDAVFFDGADEWMKQKSHTWAVASNVPPHASAEDGLKVMMDVRVQTVQMMQKHGKYPIIS